MCDHGEPRGPRYCALCRRAGIQAAEQGQAQALTAADGNWHDNALRFIRYMASTGATFTSDDITNRVGLPNASEPNRNNAVGALLASCARRGLIRRVGYEQAGRSLSHGRQLSVWVGGR